jgi:hypothetical protein
VTGIIGTFSSSTSGLVSIFTGSIDV